MGEVRVMQTFQASACEAERCWYDTDRWPEWIDGLATVVEVDASWPEEGSHVVWESGPAGRGRVREVVIEHAAQREGATAVEDASIKGTQRVVFEPLTDGVQVELSLDYAIKRRSPLTPLIDRLFVRRLMALSLAKTIDHFGAVLASGQPSVGR